MSNLLGYQQYLDKVIEVFTTGEYYEQVFKAKQEYFDRAGIVYEDDAEFENRMCIFTDWYLFDRELPTIDLPPMRFYYRKNKDNFSKEEEPIYRDFCETIHSLFYLKKLSGDLVHIKDLFTRKSYEVLGSDITIGFMSGDIFEARLIAFKGQYQFSKGFCFHPVEMEKFILGEIKKIRDQERSRQTKLIMQLAAMKLKHMRYQHINIKHVYTFEPKF